MDQWEEAYIQHPIHEQLKLTLLHIDQAQKQADQQGGDDVFLGNRAHLIVLSIKARLQRVDPQLVDLGILTEISEGLKASDVELESYYTEEYPNGLMYTNTELEACLKFINNIFIISSLDEEKALRDSLKKLRHSAAKNLGELRKEVRATKESYAGFTATIENIQDDIENQTTRLDNLINGIQERFTNEQDSRAEEFQIKLGKFYDDHSEFLLDIKEEISTSAESQTQALESFKVNLKNESETFLENQKQDFKILSESTALEIEEILQLMATKKEEVEKLVGIVTNTSLAGKYQEVANNENTAKWTWRVLSSFAMIGLIYFGIQVFNADPPTSIEATKNTPEIAIKFAYLNLAQHLGIRIFLALALGVFAAFAAKQANKHESMERRNRRMELELAAITPYIKDFEAEDQLQIKKDMIDKFFGQEHDLEKAHQDKGSEGNILSLASTLKDVVGSLKDIVKKIKP